MKTIKLLNLHLTNFKGIRELPIDFSGVDTKVYGNNGTGKTTIFDAFVWLLFNKDSQNKSDFEVKTMENDKVIHNLNHEVEATLLIDGQELILKKVYYEKWTKKRGEVTHKFGGHTTDYYINEVPSKKKEYEETIAEIIDENVFKLLTNPSEFNINMHWKDRRDLLFDIAGDVTDEDVIASNRDLSKLLDALKGRSIDDLKKIIAGKRKEINDKLKEIPTRIDEIHRNKPDTSGLSETDITSRIDKLSLEIEEKNNEINTIKNGTATNKLNRKISDIDLQIANVRNEHTQNEQAALFKLKTKLQEEESNYQILQGDVRNLMQEQRFNNQKIEADQQRMEDLRNEYKQLQEDAVKQNELEFVHDDNCICPTCEQDLPQDKVDEAVAKFNKNKSDLLESIKSKQKEINETGITLKNEIAELYEENEKLQKKIDKVTETGKKKVRDIEKIKSQIEAAKEKVTPIEENGKYKQLIIEKKSLQEDITKLEQSVEESVQAVQAEIKALNEQQQAEQANLNLITQCTKSNIRIAELEAEEKQLAAAYEDLEHQLYLTEEFTKRKVEMVTENINSKFKYARFKMFDEQINGGISETCVAIGTNGESFENINNAQRINISLDIINTLSNHYGVQAPIFIDNAESVTKLIDIESQLISLVVSEQDKQLRIENENKKESEVA